jgi:hypothetical protein
MYPFFNQKASLNNAESSGECIAVEVDNNHRIRYTKAASEQLHKQIALVSRAPWKDTTLLGFYAFPRPPNTVHVALKCLISLASLA